MNLHDEHFEIVPILSSIQKFQDEIELENCKMNLKEENDNPMEPMLLESNGRTKEISKFRRFLPQVLATMARNIIRLNTGLFEEFPSIVIPSLIGLNKALNPDEVLLISPAQASWIASFAYFAHPFGAFAGWIMSDAIGRRKSLILASIPFIIGWAMLCYSQSLLMIYAAFGIMGLGFGLKEASSMTYTSEICETPIRGVMLGTAGTFASIGYFSLFVLGAFVSWRTVAMICVTIPICMFPAMLFVPETPIWLLSKNRYEKALKSLQWLRGWVEPEIVRDEYQHLRNYSIASKACNLCTKQPMDCDHTETLEDKLKQLSRRRIFKPFILIMTLEFFTQFCGVMSWRPYIIQILNAYAIQMNPSHICIIMSTLGFAARLFLLLIIKAVGKRTIYLTSSIVTCLCCFGLSAYGFSFFPSGWTSFNTNFTSEMSTNTTVLRKSIGDYNYVPLTLLLIMQFFVTIGVTTIPFMLTGEVFPFKLRSMLCSISTADRYIFAAISTKMYYNIETWLSLPGAAAFYGFISLTGFIVMYFILPETEGRSLEEIELHFSDNTRHFTDIKIDKSVIRNHK